MRTMATDKGCAASRRHLLARGAAAARNPLAWCLAGTIAATAHAAVNVRLLRRPPSPAPEARHGVSVLLPLRNEAHRLESCLRALLAQRGVADMEIVVLDDGSTDGTAAVVSAVADTDPRVRLVTGVEPPDGWLGKPHACHQLSRHARPSADVLVFVDADVVLAPDAIAAATAQLDDTGLDLVCPYPRQITGTAGERLVQPLLQWSWLTFLPLRTAERSPRRSLAAANGQFLAVRRVVYERAGGHASVRDQVLEDIALLRAVKSVGGSGTVTDGTAIATCRMYESWDELRDGYTKSLWAAFGSPAGAAATVAALGALYVLPAVAALRGSKLGLAGYAAGVAGRVVTARATGGAGFPDPLTHPASIVLFGALVVRSFAHRRRGQLHWKGRRLH